MIKRSEWPGYWKGVVQILEWVKGFCEKTGASGQLCFDFMRDSSDGRMYPFECNPRTSTIFLNFYNHDHAAQAIFNAKVQSQCSDTCCYSLVAQQNFLAFPSICLSHCGDLLDVEVQRELNLLMSWHCAGSSLIDPADITPCRVSMTLARRPTDPTAALSRSSGSGMRLGSLFLGGCPSAGALGRLGRRSGRLLTCCGAAWMQCWILQIPCPFWACTTCR